MQTTSQLYKDIVAGEHWFENRLMIDEGSILADQNGAILLFGDVAIDLTPGCAEMEHREDTLVSISTNGSLVEKEPAVGGTCADEINVSVLDDGTSAIPKKAKLSPYVRATDGQRVSEWIPQGKYYIDQRGTSKIGDEPLLVLHGYSGILMLEADYPAESDLRWPATDIQVIKEICSTIGLAISSRTIAAINKGYTIQYPAGYSCRETLGYIGAMYGGNFTTNAVGALEFVPLVGREGSYDVGLNLTDITVGYKMSGYSAVELQQTDEVSYTAGDQTGRTLTFECPWGSKEIAENVLKAVKDYAYQPFNATGVRLFDPAIEVGDTITANGTTGVLYKHKTDYGHAIVSDFEAPSNEEIDEAAPYKSTQTRKVERKYKELRATLRVQADEISAEVAAREELGSEITSKLSVQLGMINAEVSTRKSENSELRATLSLQENKIAAKVSKSGGSSSSFGWELTDSTWTLKSNNSTVLTADKNGLEIKGIITATGGKIGGFDIESNYLSYNGQTWGGTVSSGAYLGTSGLQIGTKFKVDMAGNLTAGSGTFSGTIYAGNIQYGSGAGYLSGSGLSDLSVDAAKITGSSLGTTKFLSGVNTSLGYADFANGVFNGYNTAANIYATNATISNLYIKGTGLWVTVGTTSKHMVYQNITIDGTSYGILCVKN